MLSDNVPAGRAICQAYVGEFFEGFGREQLCGHCGTRFETIDYGCGDLAIDVLCSVPCILERLE
jgi:hypothetical protein